MTIMYHFMLHLPSSTIDWEIKRPAKDVPIEVKEIQRNYLILKVLIDQDNKLKKSFNLPKKKQSNESCF